MSISDCLGNIIELNDIVKSVNTVGGKENTTYYLYSSRDKGNPCLMIYDAQGELDNNSNMNITIDSGVTLINNENWKWYKIGKVGDVYNTIFADN